MSGLPCDEVASSYEVYQGLTTVVAGIKGVFSLTCYKCLSLDRLDMDCIELKGRGTANKNQYFKNCSRKQNACSIYQGHCK